MTGTAIPTNGVGQKTTSHLNLTVSMDQWFGKIVASHKYPEVEPGAVKKWERRAGAYRRPYAGKESA